MKQGAIAITGIGAVCSLGAGIGPILEALRHARRGIGPLRHLDLPFPELVFGEAPLTNAALIEQLGLPERSTPYSRTFLLALLAAREALHHTGVKDFSDAAFITASTVGGMDVSERYFAGWKADAPMHAAEAITHPVGHHARAVADNLGMEGLVATISTACSSSANALMFGADLIRSGRASKVLAGGVDPLCRFTIEGFRSLGALDPQPSRPFTNGRKGLNLGEAAAYLLLEPLDVVLAEGRRPIALLAGYANRNDAHHITATSPEGRGPYLSMHDALQHAGISAAEVDHINAHGTGTDNNDGTELAAMERLFGTVPPFCSTKALTGHTLGAAAALEAVFSVLTIQHGFVPAGAVADAPLEGHTALPLNAPRNMPVRTVLSNSFGFGGNDSSLVFTAAS